MTRIPVEQIRKDNSNIFACDTPLATDLCRALRQERFSVATEPALLKYKHHWQATNGDKADPYPLLEFRMDIEKFTGTLPDDCAEIFALFLSGHSVKQISVLTSRALKTVYAKLKGVTQRFKDFYLREGMYEFQHA